MLGVVALFGGEEQGYRSYKTYEKEKAPRLCRCRPWALNHKVQVGPTWGFRLSAHGGHAHRIPKTDPEVL